MDETTQSVQEPQNTGSEKPLSLEELQHQREKDYAQKVGEVLTFFSDLPDDYKFVTDTLNTPYPDSEVTPKMILESVTQQRNDTASSSEDFPAGSITVTAEGGYYEPDKSIMFFVYLGTGGGTCRLSSIKVSDDPKNPDGINLSISEPHTQNEAADRLAPFSTISLSLIESGEFGIGRYKKETITEESPNNPQLSIVNTITEESLIVKRG